MDHEYELDMFTSGFTLADDASFYRHENGFRGAAASVTTLDLASDAQLRTRIPLLDRLDFYLETDMEDDFRARRLTLRVGYEVPLRRAHRVALTHSLARAKADMDWGVYYRYRGRSGMRVDADLTALDGINNIITSQRVSRFNRDTVRTYLSAPFMFTGMLSTPLRPSLFGQVALGLQPRSEAEIISLNQEDLRFTYANSFWYAGVLLEAHPIPGRITNGLVAQKRLRGRSDGRTLTRLSRRTTGRGSRSGDLDFSRLAA